MIPSVTDHHPAATACLGTTFSSPVSTSHQPSTPTDTLLTPAPSSPTMPGKMLSETPLLHLQTPVTRDKRDMREVHIAVVGESDSPTSLGLGYGDLEESRFGASTKGKGRALGEEEGSGRNYGDLELDERKGANNASGSKRGTRESSLESDDAAGWPDASTLQSMRGRLKELDGENRQGRDAWEDRKEIAGMVRTLLNPALEELPFLHQQVAAQRDTIVTLQLQAKLSEQFSHIERERYEAERNGHRTETWAMMAAREIEIAAGIRPKKLLDLDVGYHQDLEAANKRLEMDNRLMAPRLADTQRQIDKLVTELKHLRSHVILSSEPLTGAEPSIPLGPPMLPQMPGQRPPPTQRDRPARSPVKPSRNTSTMGDARSEHLLLAARKVRTMRQHNDRVGRLTLAELQRGGVVGPDGGLGYSEGYGDAAPDDDDDDDASSDYDEAFATQAAQEPRQSQNVKGKGKGFPGQSTSSTLLLPRAKRSSKRSLPAPTTPSRSRLHLPETTPGGSNFNDLLRAAEMANKPPATPAAESSRVVPQIPMSAMSATRSTTRTREEISESGSPSKRARRDGPISGGFWTRDREDGQEAAERVKEEDTDQPRLMSASNPGSKDSDPPESSALDLLASASQLETPQSQPEPQPQPQLASAARFGGMLSSQEENPGAASPLDSTGESGLAPAIDLQEIADPFSRHPPSSIIEDHQIDPALSGFDSRAQPTSTPKPRARNYSVTSNIQTPARRYSQSYSMIETPFDEGETPGRGLSPTYMSRSDALANEPLPGAFASPTGATVPGLGKYVHLSSNMPARRVRSPYLKWTIEEDELLARAVAMHGEKWDLVSKGVPTRSYHQVRQRWLRKTGAFDKKPGDPLHGASPLVGGRDPAEDEDDSPTPMGGEVKRKRKMSQF